MSSDFLKLEQELEEGKVYPVYLLDGEEEYLKERAKEMIVERWLSPSSKAFDLLVFFADETSPEEIVNSCQDLPLFSERRAVVLRRAEVYSPQTIRPLRNYLLAPSPKTVLIILQRGKGPLLKDDMKKGGYYLFLPPKGRDIPYWIKRLAKEVGVEVTPQALNLLQDLVGGDLMSLRTELEKLSLYVGDKGRIEEGDVQEIGGEVRSPSAFQLAEAILKGDLKGGFDALGRLWQKGEPPLKILGAIAWQFRQRGDKETLKVLRRLYETDLQLKRSALPWRFLLEGLLMELRSLNPG